MVNPFLLSFLVSSFPVAGLLHTQAYVITCDVYTPYTPPCGIVHDQSGKVTLTNMSSSLLA